MKNRKNPAGFTLVEVILASVILFFVAAFILANVSESYAMMTKTKAITSNTFSLVQQAEQGIQLTKQALDNGDTVAGAENYTLFGDSSLGPIEVTGYPQWFDGDNNVRLFTVVGEQQIEALPVPVITDLALYVLTDDSGGDLISTVDNACYRFLSTNAGPEFTKLQGIADYITNDVYYGITYQWYISYDTYSTMYYGAANADPQLYPSFPADYRIYNMRSALLPSIPEEALGHFMVLTARPISTVGKLGETVVSKPIYIAALPQVSPTLAAHWDIGLLDQLNILTTDNDPNLEFDLATWNDFTKKGHDATITAGGAQPHYNPKIMFAERLDNNGVSTGASLYGKSLTFPSGAVMNANWDSTTYNGTAVFVVAKASSEVKLFSSSLLTLTTKQFSTMGSTLTDDTLSVGADGEWHVYGGVYSSSNRMAGFSIDDQLVTATASTSNIHLNGAQIGALTNSDSFEVAEVVVYTGTMNTSSDGDYAKVVKSLMNKYGIRP